MFADIAAAQPIRVLSLRYFNPIGADPKMRTGLQLARPTHALGKMIQAQQEGVPFVITGTDWPTRDGTGLRDYVHVWDLAAAHVAALTRFDALPGPATAINLGTGTGTTVRELLAAFDRVAGRPVGARGGPTARGRRRRLQPDRPRGTPAGLAAAVRPRRGHQPFAAVGRAPRRDPARLGRPSCAALIWAFPSACSYNEVILMGNQPAVAAAGPD